MNRLPTNPHSDQTANVPVQSDPMAARGAVQRPSQTRGPSIQPPVFPAALPAWCDPACRANARVNRALDRVSLAVALVGLAYFALAGLAALPALLNGAVS